MSTLDDLLDAADGLIESFDEVEHAQNRLYDVATHRWVDLLRDLVRDVREQQRKLNEPLEEVAYPESTSTTYRAVGGVVRNDKYHLLLSLPLDETITTVEVTGVGWIGNEKYVLDENNGGWALER